MTVPSKMMIVMLTAGPKSPSKLSLPQRDSALKPVQDLTVQLSNSN
jgi:hypothetical protein